MPKKLDGGFRKREPSKPVQQSFNLLTESPIPPSQIVSGPVDERCCCYIGRGDKLRYNCPTCPTHPNNNTKWTYACRSHYKELLNNV